MFSLPDLRPHIGEKTDPIICRVAERQKYPRNAIIYTSQFRFNLNILGGYYSRPLSVFSHWPLASENIMALPTRRLDRRLWAFYTRRILPRLCQDEREVEATFVDTARLDFGIMERVRERVDLGRFVAYPKAGDDPRLSSTGLTRAELLSLLRDHEQEERVIEAARRSASKLGLDSGTAEFVFQWLMNETLNVEVEFLLRGGLGHGFKS